LHDLVGHIPGAEDQLTLDGPSLNFAQAALVLQNSSNIYSRKVEYLYALVYKSLEENFQVQNGKVVRQKHADPDIDDFLAFDPYQEFLLLDDVLPTDDSPDNRKIDLVETAEGSTPGRSMTRLSLTENKSVTAINDVAYKTLLDPHGSTLRLLKAPVAEDGWLRLPGTNSGKRQSLSAPLSPLPQTIQEHSGEESMEMQSGFGAFDSGNDNDDDDGPGFFMNVDDDEEELLVATQPMAVDKPARHVTFAESVPTPKRDPWALLDPHSVDSATKSKPLKVGKSIRLPEGITEPPSACVTGARTRRIIRPNNPTPQPDTATGKRRFDATESFNSQCAFGKRSVNDNDNETLSFLPLQGLAFGDEFTYVYQATMKRLAAQRRELRQQAQSKAAQSNFNEEDEDDQYGDGFVFGGDDDDNDYGDATDYPQEGNTGMVSLDEMYNRDNGKFMQLQMSRNYQFD
jgi:condensin-2 complex subunit H2